MIVKRALETKYLDQENKRLKKELDQAKGLGQLIGRSRIMQSLFERIKTISETRSTVLITGESGTGKELIASAIHNLSPRKDRSFITVNCAALSENLIESELFGHEKGAFTGAINKKDGRFKVADGGTLFLDEIGELSLPTQVKLLRVIQEKTFEPVGANYSITVDVRIIAATNQNLKARVKDGTFREDLFYRLNVINLEAPPLRDRKDDIALLVNHFLEEQCKELQKPSITLSPEALAALVRHNWPGNVRQLQNTIENLVVFSRSDTITQEMIPTDFIQAESGGISIAPASVNLADNEKKLIIQALEATRYNKTKAAKQLGMSRRTIHRKIKEYGLNA